MSKLSCISSQLAPSIILFLAMALFGGSHLWMSVSGFRNKIIEKYDVIIFNLIFVCTTIFSSIVVGLALASYGHLGVGGFEVNGYLSRSILALGSSLGAFLIVVGLFCFPGSAIAKLAQQGSVSAGSSRLKVSAAEAITRHPFFVGLAIMAFCHIFLSSTLAVAIFFLGLFLFCVIGVRMQDRKLSARWGEIYDYYMAQTSIFPCLKFHIYVSKFSRIDWLYCIVWALLSYTIFSEFHSFWSFANGAGFVAIITVYGTIGVSYGVIRSRS